MDKKTELLITSLVESMPMLSFGQLNWLERVVQTFQQAHEFRLEQTGFLDQENLSNFGDALRIHHSFSAEAFSKDKFEYVLNEVLNSGSGTAKLAPKGNPGHDITINGERFSLKTQADKGLKENRIWISKFMELGKGDWGDDPEELTGLLNQFIRHLDNYERILDLRTLSKGPNWGYELVEIPKEVLLSASSGVLEMKIDSRQNPKPGYCFVKDDQGNKMFNLYFDGGGERKLQIKDLEKSLCIVHATWKFHIPTD